MPKESTGQARARNLEILKYGRTLLPGLKFASQQQASLSETNRDTINECEDPMLTALAQLAVLRMNAKRAFVCLVDDQELHILAEATKTISPFDVSCHLPDDELQIGVQSVSLNYCISSLSFPAYLGDHEAYVNHETRLLDASRMVVPDLKLDPMTANIPFVANSAIAQSYIEVPLRNPTGILIGLLAVLNDVSLSFPTSIDVQPMQNIAQLIVNHLELVSLKDVTVRAERLIQGLGHFNSGHSSISKWAMSHPKQALHSDAANHAVQKRTDVLALQEQSRPFTLGDEQSSILSPFTVTTTEDAINNSLGLNNRTSTLPTTNTPSAATEPSVNGSIGRTSMTDDTLGPTSMGLPSDTEISINGSETNKARLTIAHTFARASNLIRESMDLDGVCFLELSSAGRFNIDNQKHNRILAHQASPTSTTATLQNKRGQKVHSTTEAPSDTSDKSEPEMPMSTARSKDDLLCKRIAFSRRDKSSLSAASLSQFTMTLTEGDLKEMIRVYSTGRIYNFDADGAISSGDEKDFQGSPSRTSLKRELARVVSKGFTHARSLIFIPLYDIDRRHPYAAFFGWTQDAFRVLVESESVYVSGFTHSLMCEVMRLETLATDQAKSDFISSISHELRSPLHGILAAVQLLQESNLSGEQTELAIMVDSCGKTLLDVLDHVLEHARINNVIKLKKKSKLDRRARRIGRIVDHGLSEELSDNSAEPVNLAAVVEETVASIAAGHYVKTHRKEQSSTRRLTKPAGMLAEQANSTLSLAVIMNIGINDHWFCKVDAGSWRRIVMNLLGNALKYTVRGHVSVSLQLGSDQKSGRGVSRNQVVLTIQDTGQGISDSYLKHRLYTPFAQENNLSVGAGLGLSIVERLVASMGGKIDVQSEIDVGTKIVVCVPVETQRSSIQDSAEVRLMEFVRSGIRQHDKVCLVGFDIYPDLDQEPTGIMTAHAQALLEMKGSLIDLISTWLGVQITFDASEATILIVEKSHDVAAIVGVSEGRSKDVILIAAYGPTEAEPNHQDTQHNFLTAPIGPLKIFRAFQKLIERRIMSLNSPPTSPSCRVAQDQTNNSNGLTASVDAKSSPIGTNLSGRKPSIPSNVPRLLLVDDNDINLRLLSNFVRKLNLPFLTATNGQIALERYKSAIADKYPVSYIFMDLSMPIMDGLMSTRLIRAHEKELGITNPAFIVALTGLGHADTQREAEQSGFDQYFCKPVKLGLLKEILNGFIN